VAHLQPSLRAAVRADVAITLRCRGEGRELAGRWDVVREIVRLSWVTDAFFAQFCYRVRTALAVRRVPVLPLVLHRLSMTLGQICIGDPVVIGPGLYIAHGQVVVDGITRLGHDTILFPWTTIGLRAGDWNGPTIGDGVTIGTGSRIIGPVRIGDGAQIGANAVVIDDVPNGSTVVGVPARVVDRPSGGARD
jgi:serine O-acetyltransferase